MRYFFAKHLIFMLLCLVICTVNAEGAPVQNVGKVSGIVSDAIGHPLAGAVVSVKDAAGKVVMSAQSDTQGHFAVSGLPVGVYVVTAEKSGYRNSIKVANLVAEPAMTVDLVLASTKALEIQVVAKRLRQARNAISVETGSSVYKMADESLATLPEGRNTSLDKVVLRAPGVAQDSFGQIHVRGDHGDIQYRINDIIIPESITGFGQALDTRFAQSLDLLTGALPAQYGYRTAGIVNIHTRTGAFEQGGRIGVMGGSHDTRKAYAELSGSENRLSYYVTGSQERNNLGIENPTPARSALHDRQIRGDGFAYLSYLLNDTTQLSLISGTSDNAFQIPNNPGQAQNYTYSGVPSYPSANLNDNQHELTHYGIVALQQSLDNGLDYQLSAFTRYSQVVFYPDPIGDLIYTGVASNIKRSSLASGLQADASYKVTPHHTLRTGLFLSNERSASYNDSLVFPTVAGVQSSSVPFAISDNSSKVSQLYGVYVQDEWRLNDKLTVNYGLRADWVNAYVTASQWSPRIGFVYRLTPTTTLHAGYARYFTPPPTELIAPTTIALYQNTTNAPPGSGNDPVKAQSSNYYDAGISQQFGPYVTVGIDGYYRQVTNLLDEGQFGAAMVFTPFNYSQGRIYGVELTASYHRDNLSAYLNLARATALGKGIVSSQYNFDPAELSYIATHWIHLDHDQTLTGSTGVSYDWHHTTVSLDGLYGSGLRSGFANTGHLPAYFQANGSLAHSFRSDSLGGIEARLSVINIFDKVYLIRDGTGVGVGAPQYGPRRAFYAELSKAF